MIITFDKAKSLIREADILLFRASCFPSIGWALTRYTGGIHSRVALAHIDRENIYCVEQKEFIGGRSVLLESQLDHEIDVYRASPEIQVPSFNGENVVWQPRYLDFDTANKISETALSITGQRYGWDNIWNIFKGYAPFFRLLRKNKNEDYTLSKAYV